MRKVSKAFFTGLAAILPIAITLYILYWLGTSAERALGNLLPSRLYLPGMGLIAGVGVILLVGLALQAWVFRKLFAYGEHLLKRIPVVKTVYSAARDLIAFFSASKDKTMNQVVMVTLGESSLRLIGFVTREDFSAYPAGMAEPGTIAVYFPMSYQVGGFTAMMPSSAVKAIDMSFQDAMRFALTAGMSSEEKEG
jgi:uncharacterized membrane protein